MGQRLRGKYFRFAARDAPLADRTSCSYSHDFVTLPLGDSKVATDLASNFKSRGSGSLQGSGAPFSGSSKYTDQFTPFTKDQVRSAKRSPVFSRADTCSSG